MSNILIADSDESLRQTIQTALTKSGHTIETASSGKEAVKKIEQGKFDLFLMDFEMPNTNGMEVLKEARGHSPTTIIIVMSAHASIENAVEAMHYGAYDYIIKPFDIEGLEIKIERLLEQQRIKLENELLKESLYSKFGPMIGASYGMQHVYNLIEKVAPTPAPVLITGKSGTGKELVAREIHRRSQKKSGPFIAMNCVALASGLLESELFGHEKGSFTGATGMRKGCFEIANNGTLFLDEVGELNDTTQVKLLRFLQEKEFQRVGGNKVIRVDVRVIAATNQDLEQRIIDNMFREDLFYRLNMFRIDLPPLCERGDDIVALAQYFVERFNRDFGKNVTLSPEVMAILKLHNWPGNVRELENVIGQAVILAEGETIKPRHLPFIVSGVLAGLDIGEIGENIPLNKQMEMIESEIIRKTLEETDWRQSEAARRLGLKRTSLQYKVEKYKLMQQRKK